MHDASGVENSLCRDKPDFQIPFKREIGPLNAPAASLERQNQARATLS